MKWTKPDPALVERFTSALPDDPRVASRKMFGYPACFVRGSYFAGLHGEAFVIRLPGSLKERFPRSPVPRCSIRWEPGRE